MTIRATEILEGVQERTLAGFMILAGLMLLHVLAFDQGQILSVVMGQTAYHQNLLHELFHDGRHLFAFACH
jgi:hypothetical protein